MKFSLPDFFNTALSTYAGHLQGQMQGQEEQRQRALQDQQRQIQLAQFRNQLEQQQREDQLAPYKVLSQFAGKMKPEDLGRFASDYSAAASSPFVMPSQYRGLFPNEPTAPRATLPAPPLAPSPTRPGAAAAMGVGAITMPQPAAPPVAPAPVAPAPPSQMGNVDTERLAEGPRPAAATTAPGASTAPATPSPGRLAIQGPGGKTYGLRGVSDAQARTMESRRTATLNFLRQYKPEDATTKQTLAGIAQQLQGLNLDDENDYQTAENLLAQVAPFIPGGNYAIDKAATDRWDRRKTKYDETNEKLTKPNVAPGFFGRRVGQALREEQALLASASEGDKASAPRLWSDFADQIGEMEQAYAANDDKKGDGLARDIQAAVTSQQTPAQALAETRLGMQVIGELSPEDRKNVPKVVQALKAAGLNAFAGRVKQYGVNFGSADAEKEMLQLMGMAGTYSTMPLEARKFFVDRLVGAAAVTGKPIELKPSDIQKFDPADRLKILRLQQQLKIAPEYLRLAQAKDKRENEAHNQRMAKLKKAGGGINEVQTAGNLYKIWRGVVGQTEDTLKGLGVTRADWADAGLEPEQEQEIKDLLALEEQGKQDYLNYLKQQKVPTTLGEVKKKKEEAGATQGDKGVLPGGTLTKNPVGRMGRIINPDTGKEYPATARPNTAAAAPAAPAKPRMIKLGNQTIRFQTRQQAFQQIKSLYGNKFKDATINAVLDRNNIH